MNVEDTFQVVALHEGQEGRKKVSFKPGMKWGRDG